MGIPVNTKLYKRPCEENKVCEYAEGVTRRITSHTFVESYKAGV
jgi:hypothetical protein